MTSLGDTCDNTQLSTRKILRVLKRVVMQYHSDVLLRNWKPQRLHLQTVIQGCYLKGLLNAMNVQPLTEMRADRLFLIPLQ